MRLLKILFFIALSAGPAFPVDLSGSSYIGLTQQVIRSNFKCSPSMLILGGGKRLICRDDLGGRFNFILYGGLSVDVTIQSTRPPMTKAEATALLQSQCTANEGSEPFICGDMLQGLVKESVTGVSIKLCKNEYC